MRRRGFIGRAGCAAVVLTAAVKSGISDTRDNIKRLVNWVSSSFVGGKINLVPNLPSGKTRGGTERNDLKNLYWLQNCNLFAMHALRPYDSELAKKIEKSYRKWYATEFKDCMEKTEHYLALGRLPGAKVPEGSFFRAVLKVKEYDGFRIGTETYDPKKLGRINDRDPRGLLKFGALGAQIRGDSKKAQEYFTKALALWDGHGFTHTRMDRHQSYYTRYLAYALIAERILKTRIPPDTRRKMEGRIWTCQDKDGGIWTNYNKDGSFPGFAKKTSEIGPLVLLACRQGGGAP